MPIKRKRKAKKKTPVKKRILSKSPAPKPAIPKTKEYLSRISRAIKVLKQSNQTLLRSENETQFMQQVCRNIIETGGYRLAWIGFAENDGNRTVRPSAQYGYEDGYLSIANITWADGERGRGPTGTCIRTGKPVVSNDILNDPRLAPWRESALKRGYASSVGLPLMLDDGKAIGALTIYAQAPDAFDEEELDLLMELAADASYGIAMLRMKKEYDRAIDGLRDNYEKLKELDRLKSNFLAIVSHELRTPLTVIKGYLVFLLKGVADQLAPQQKEFISIADSNADRLTTIINGLIDIAKIEAGILKIQKQEKDIVLLLNETIRDIGYLAARKNIKIEKEFGMDSLELDMDNDRMQQVLVNLINNAIKFSPENSSIKIGINTVKKKNISSPRACPAKCEDCALIYIQDKGIGLEKENLEKVFGDFFQVEDANHRTHEGIGIGLGIVRKIVDAHDGAVWAESEGLNKGTTFKVVLPVPEQSRLSGGRD